MLRLRELCVAGSALVAGARGAELAVERGNPGTGAEERNVVAPVSRSASERRAESALDDAALAALERGLQYLARQQALSADGSLPRGSPSSATTRDSASQSDQDEATRAGEARSEPDGAPADDPSVRAERRAAPVAVTALGALAFMASGSTPDRGPYGSELSRAIDYLLAHTELDPAAATAGYISARGDAISRMHGHGFATLALAQAYSMSPKSPRGARIEHALTEAVRLIERTQSVEGGWYYEPVKSAHEGSITICLVQALRAAHNAGIKVDSGTIARALDYVVRSQKEDGSFRYALGDDHSTVALTAAAIATLHASGTYEGRVLDEGLAYVFRGLAMRDDALAAMAVDAWTPESDGKHVHCPHYERLYVAQALWQNPDHSVFATWSTAERRRVLTSQRTDGAWSDARFGDCYATAMSCLFLALPEELLPIFQR